MDALALVRLLQLASPVLPVGAYSYSQGLEWLVECGTVHDAQSAAVWIGDLLEQVMAQGEAAVQWRLGQAAESSDWERFRYWNSWFRASRETAELRAETQQMGSALIKLLGDLHALDAPARRASIENVPVTSPASFALAGRAFKLPAEQVVVAYLWSWLENQVLAAIKTVPLGQVAGQKLLLALGARIPAAVACVREIADDDVASFAPGLALASSRHETQYTRLFRS